MLTAVQADRTIMSVGSIQASAPVDAIGSGSGAHDQIMPTQTVTILDDQAECGGTRAIDVKVFAVRGEFKAFDGHPRTATDHQGPSGLPEGRARFDVARPATIVTKAAMQADAGRHTIDAEIVGSLGKDNRPATAVGVGEGKRSSKAGYRLALAGIVGVIAIGTNEDQLAEQTIKTVTVLITPILVERVQRVCDGALVLASIRRVFVKVVIAGSAGAQFTNAA